MDLAVLRAAQNGNTEILKTFLEEGGDYNIREEKNWSLIFHAVLHGHVECVKLILERAKLDHKSVNELVKNVLGSQLGYTPLSIAASQGYHEIVELLADLYSKSKVDYESMEFPLHEACIHRRNKSIEILVKKMPQFIDKPDGGDPGKCPIHITVRNGNIEGIKILLQNGCDINALVYPGQTPLHVAINNNNYEMVKFLADKVGDINARDLDNNTPLLLATQCGSPEIVRCLLDNGADATKTKPYYNQPCLPIDLATELGRTDIFKVLAEFLPRDKKSVVCYAAVRNRFDILRYLFENGFSTFDSYTKIFNRNVWHGVLNHRPSNGLPDIVKILLENFTSFHFLAHESRFCKDWTDVYFLSYTLADARLDVLTQFLNAGILELRFDCNPLPHVIHIIEIHKEYRDDVQYDSDDSSDYGGIDPERNVPGILACLKYFPFITWSHKNLELPTPDNFGDGDLIQIVPSLLDLTRWEIRCLIIKNKGMIHWKYVENLKLPKKVTEFLLEC